MKKHFPRKLNDEAEDKAARDAIIRENEELVKEIITLRELKDLTKEQFGEIERKMLQLKEDAKRISQNIDSELERINASGKAKFKKFDKVAEQEARAAANRGEESTVASKLATLSSKPVTAPVDFEDTPAGREKRKLADKHRKHIRKLEEKFLLLRRNVEPGNPSLIEAERAYKDAVKYGNDTYGLGIVELEEAKEESRAVMEERIQITAESIISRLNELDSQRRKLFTEMHNLPKLVN